MSPRHHLDHSTLVAYAAGSLAVELAAVAASHLEVCAQCRQGLHEAERIGGLLLEQQRPAQWPAERADALRRSLLDRLDDPPAMPVPPLRAAVDSTAGRADPDRLPVALRPHFGDSYSGLKWRWMAPGVHCIRARAHRNLFLLKIGPGRSMPVHSHGGSELTQILQGAYQDRLGHFGPGDVADLDSDIEHQPVTLPGMPCICVSALDAPLRFPGWLARKLQPYVGL